MATTPDHAASPPRSALVQWAGAGLSAWVTTHFYQWNLSAGENAEWWGLATLLSGAVTLRFLWRGLEADAARRRVKSAERQFRKVTKTQGSARWGTKKDAKQAGLFAPGGLYLGELNNQEVFWQSENSALVLSPPGGGKTTASLIQNALRNHVDADGRPSSLFFLDLKGEILLVCRKQLEALGYEIEVVAPWSKKMSEELGADIPDMGYNPILPLMSAGEDTKDEAERIAKLMIPEDTKASGSSKYFMTGGREFLVWLILILVYRGDPARCNLVEMRSQIMSSGEEIDALLAETSHSDAFNGALSQYARKLTETRLNASEEWSGLINTCTQSLGIYDPAGPLGRHVSVTDGFEPASIKAKRKAVFFVMPSERTVSHAPYMNLFLSTAIERMVTDRTNRRVTLFLDEFCNAGVIPNLLAYLALFRGQGCRFVFYSQTGTSQITRLYGREGLNDILSMVDCVVAFGLRDHESCRLLSDMAGHDTIKEFSQNRSADERQGGAPKFTTTASHQSRPLIRPEDIRRLPSDKALVFLSNHPPLLLDKVSYLQRTRLRKLASPNPYYEREGT
jgi:type IV secretion system protein VirD4